VDSIHIVILEDRDLVRMGLQTAIEEVSNCRLVGAFATIAELNRCLQRENAHILFLDDTLPGIDTQHFIRNLKQEYPALRIIVFGSHLTAANMCEMIDAKADGFVYKGEEMLHVIPQAIAFAARGELFFSPQLSKVVMNYTRTNKPIELSDRLKQVLLLIARDFTPKQMAQTLGISDKAVYSARDRLKELLNAETTAGIVSRAIELGLIDPKEIKQE
jgi:DNA-binding NarL/FixJ family response regulator